VSGLAARRWAIALVAGVGLALGAAPGAAQEAACPVPEGFAAFETPLPRTTKALAGGAEIAIVTIGGASSLGSAAGGAAFAWPSRLAAALSISGCHGRPRGRRPIGWAARSCR
jgi:hypothetical protein